MTQLAHIAAPVERLLIFQAFNQQHTSSFRDELHCLLNSKNSLSDPVIGIHFASSLGFSFLPHHFLFQECTNTPEYYQDILHTIHEICKKNTSDISGPMWLILDMCWIKHLPNPVEQQELFIQAVIQSEVLKRHHIVFHFNLEVMGGALVQQSMPLYPYLYWNQQLAQNVFFHSPETHPAHVPIHHWLSMLEEPSNQAHSTAINEASFHQTYDCFPYPVLEADYSEIMQSLTQLIHEQPNDWRTCLHEDFHFVIEMLKRLKIKHANQTAVQWVAAEREEEFFQRFPSQPSHLVIASFHEHLIQLAEGIFPAQFTIDLDVISNKEYQIVLDVVPLQPGNFDRMLLIAQQNTSQMEKGLLESSLYKISQLVHTERDMDSLYGAIHTILNGLVNAKNMYIAIYDEEKQSLHYPFHADELDEYPGQIKLRDGKTEYVLKTGETLWVSNEKDEENIRQGKYSRYGSPSSDWLGVPLITQGKSIGVITIQTYDGSRLTENDKFIMEFCSSQIAFAIERKIAENRLLQNQQELSQILMGSSIPTRVVDKHKKTTLFNKAYERFSGLSAEEILDSNKNPWVLLNRPEVPTITELIASSASESLILSLYTNCVKKHPLIDGAYLSENLRIQTRNGLYWVDLTSSPLKDLQGNITGAIENVQDMSQRVKAEDDIRTFKTVADYANTGMLIANPDKQIVYINTYLAKKLGYTPEQLHMKPVNTLFKIHYNQIDALMERITNDTNELRDIEISMQSSEDENIPFLINAVKIETTLNQKSLISFACFNISTQKKREEALNRYANRLEILHKIDEAILEANTTEEIASTALHIFLQLVKFSYAGIIEIRTENSINLYQAHYDRGRYTEGNQRSLPCSAKLMTRLSKFDLFISQDVNEITKEFEEDETFPQHLSIQSCMVIPLIVKHDVIGQFIVGFSQEKALSPEIVEIIKEVSRMISIGIYQTHLYEKIEEMATIDELTGIFNRRQLIDLGERCLAQATRYFQPLSVIVFDIDHYKHVNDTYGHPFGDQVLKAVVKRCQGIVRGMDVFGRYGGDEFVIVLPETGIDQANQVANRLKTGVYDTQFQLNDILITLSISVGISELKQPTDTLTDLINQADEAMYVAKKSGRNKIVLTH